MFVEESFIKCSAICVEICKKQNYFTDAVSVKGSIKIIIAKVRLYLKDAINNLKKSDTWKIQLTIAIPSNYVSSKDNDE